MDAAQVSYLLLLTPPQLTKMKALDVWDWVRAEVVTFWTCFNHFYEGKLCKTGSLLLWKCAWGSCMTDPWTSLLSCTSLTSTTGDSRETVWHGDPPEGDSFAHPSAQGGITRGQIRTNQKERRAFNRTFLKCKQYYSHKLGSSMSMLVGPLQFGGLPMEVLDWAQVELGTFCCLNKKNAPTGSLFFGEFAAVTADRLMQRPLKWTSLTSTASNIRETVWQVGQSPHRRFLNVIQNLYASSNTCACTQTHVNINHACLYIRTKTKLYISATIRHYIHLSVYLYTYLPTVLP